MKLKFVIGSHVLNNIYPKNRYLPKEKFEVKFLRVTGKEKTNFCFPLIDDVAKISKESIVRTLRPILNQKATARQRKYLNFGVNFNGEPIY